MVGWQLESRTLKPALSLTLALKIVFLISLLKFEFSGVGIFILFIALTHAENRRSSELSVNLRFD